MMPAGGRPTGRRGGGYYNSPPLHCSPELGHYHTTGASPTTYPSANVGAERERGRPPPPPLRGGCPSMDDYEETYEQARVYLDPPRPRNDASQARLWSAGYMRPFQPSTSSGRNVECCIPVMGEDGVVRPCGSTLKHNLGRLHTAVKPLLATRNSATRADKFLPLRFGDCTVCKTRSLPLLFIPHRDPTSVVLRRV